jgi:primosomal protein N''
METPVERDQIAWQGLTIGAWFSSSFTTHFPPCRFCFKPRIVVPGDACSLTSDWIKVEPYVVACRGKFSGALWKAKMTTVADPVEKLVKLLGDDTRVDDRIRATQAALALAKKRVSESLAQHYIATGEPRIQLPEDLMREEQSYERLLQALQDMKTEIAKQIRPVEQQIIQANIDHLRQAFSQESRRLSKCLEEIDDNILACRQYLQDYERIRSGLHMLNEKLIQLGADKIPVPDALGTTDLGEIVRQRIDHLRSQGKI